MAEHKQKVLMVHNYYQIPGGEDTVVANEKKLLENHGHKVILYTRHNNELHEMGVFRKLSLPFTTIFNLRTYRDIQRIIKQEQIDIIHVHNTLNLISPSVYYAAVRLGVPVIQTIHNFRFLCSAATFYRDGHICEDCVSNGMKCAVKHKCYRNSRLQTIACVVNTWIHRHTGILKKIHYICLTEFNRSKFLQLKQIRADQVFIKPNFSPRSKTEYMGKQREYYLFAGRIEEIKGIHILIEAFSKMPDKKLIIIGDGPLLDKMENLVNANKCNQIEFAGRVDHNQALAMMGKAKAVIISSQVYETFPMIIPEAFSTGTPVIAGNIGNTGILIKDGINGFKFTYNSSDSLMETIMKFETIDFKQLCNNALNQYRQEYSEEINYNILKSIYDQVHV